MRQIKKEMNKRQWHPGDIPGGQVRKTSPSNTRCEDLTPDRGAKTPHSLWPKSIKRKKCYNKFNKDFFLFFFFKKNQEGCIHQDPSIFLSITFRHYVPGRTLSQWGLEEPSLEWESVGVGDVSGDAVGISTCWKVEKEAEPGPKENASCDAGPAKPSGNSTLYLRCPSGASQAGGGQLGS